MVKAMANAEARITEYFKDGGGMLWGEHDADLFIGAEKFFRPVIPDTSLLAGYRLCPASTIS